MKPTPDHTARYILLAHVAAFGCTLIWGLNFTMIKIATAELSPMGMYLLRYGLAAMFAMSLWLFRKPRLGELTKRHWLTLVVLAALVGPLYQVLLIFGAAHTSAALIGMLIATQSLHIGWQAPLVLKEKPVMLQIAALLLGMVGVSIPLIAAGDFSYDALIYPGAIALAAALSGLNTVIPRRMRASLHPVEMMPMMMAIAVLLSLPMLATGVVGEWRELTGKGWGVILFLSTVGLPLPHLLWYFAVRHIDAVTAAFYFFIMMVMSTIWGVILLDEGFVLVDAVAGGIIFVGLMLNARGSQIAAAKRKADDPSTARIEPEPEVS